MTPRSNLSRRSFLATGAVAASAVALGWRPARAALADSLKQYNGWHMGIQAHSLRSMPVAQAVKTMAELQLHFVEFSKLHIANTAPPDEIAAVKKMCAENGLTITAHGVNPLTKNHDANKRVFEFAKALGCRNITSNPMPDAFDSLDKLVKEYDIRIAIHNHGPGATYPKAADAIALIKDLDPRIGLCVDTGHSIRAGEDPVAAIREGKGRVFGVHLKDFAEAKKEAEIVVLGKGHLDVPGVFRALNDIGFPADGAISLEYEGQPDNPLPPVKACLEVVAAATQSVPRK